jgi:hypothetical protein
MAWAATALVFVPDGAPGFLIFLAWLGAAWKCCAGDRTLARRIVVGLVAIALPLQGFAAIAMALRGPAHFHGVDHGHAHVERHHHTAGDGAIEVGVEDDHRHAPLAAGDNKRTAFASVDTLSTALPVLPPRLHSAPTPGGRCALLAAPFPDRPERPPTPELL